MFKHERTFSDYQRLTRIYERLVLSVKFREHYCIILIETPRHLEDISVHCKE